MARGGGHVVCRRGGQTQYSSTSLKHHTPRGEGWSQDGVVAARGEGFAQRGGRRKLSARRGGQILRGSGTGGSLSVMVEGRSGPNARNTRFALVRSLPQLAAALDPGIPGRHPLAVGLSRVQREGHRGARVAARAEVAPLPPDAAERTRFALVRSRPHLSLLALRGFPAQRSQGGSSGRKGQVGRRGPWVAARAEVAFGRPRAATGRRRAVRRRQGEASGAARGGGRPGGVGGREAGWLHGLGVGRRGSRCLNALSQEAQNGESLNASLKSRTPVGKLPLQIVEVEAS